MTHLNHVQPSAACALMEPEFLHPPRGGASWVSLVIVGDRLLPARSPFTYLAHVLAHPLHFIVAGTIAAFVLALAPWLIAVVALADVFVAVVISSMRPVRDQIDASCEAQRVEAASEQRDTFLALMAPRHRRAIEKLERMVRRIRADAVTTGGVSAAVVGDLDLDQLLALYARLALEHAAASRRHEQCDRHDIDVALERLSRKLTAPDQSPALRAVIARRLALTRRRAATWRRNRARLELSDQYLEAIDDAITLLYERTITSSATDDLIEQIDEIALDAERGDAAVCELRLLVGGARV